MKYLGCSLNILLTSHITAYGIYEYYVYDPVVVFDSFIKFENLDGASHLTVQFCPTNICLIFNFAIL